MSATTRDKLAFVHAMAHHTRATVRQCEALMRYAATLQRLAEDDCNIATDDAGQARRDAKKLRIANKVLALCNDLAPMTYDVVRNCYTIATGLNLIDAESLRDSHLEHTPDVECKVICMGVRPLFQNDPRGAVLKIRVPSGWSDDFGGEGICVPS